MAQRITVKIEREPIAIRRGTSEPEPSPDLLIQVRSNGNLVDGLETAIRLLTSERDAIMEKVQIKKLFAMGEEDDDEDEVEV